MGRILRYLKITPAEILQYTEPEVKNLLYDINSDIAALEDNVKILTIRIKALEALNDSLRIQVQATQEAKVNTTFVDKFWKLLALIAGFFATLVGLFITTRKNDG
jgi:hypothetical protein